jgi:hypothetical protein
MTTTTSNRAIGWQVSWTSSAYWARSVIWEVLWSSWLHNPSESGYGCKQLIKWLTRVTISEMTCFWTLIGKHYVSCLKWMTTHQPSRLTTSRCFSINLWRRMNVPEGGRSVWCVACLVSSRIALMPSYMILKRKKLKAGHKRLLQSPEL